MSKVIKGREFEEQQAAKGAVIAPVHPKLPVTSSKDGVLRHRVISASAEAEKILLHASQEADRIREEAKKVLNEVETVREEARRKGYAEGEAKGLAQVSEQLIALHHLKEKFYEEAEPEVMKLVLSIAEKIIGNLVSEHSDAVKHVVKESLEKAIGDQIVVRVNPEDYQTILSSEGEFRKVIDRTRRLVFKEDDSILKGGCIVETEVGTIDAQIETQLQAIKKALS
ncbi:MAG: hypothetical protein A3I05_03395 [Deltaproteobacteria bacterium RIFCSPLOWO2_02_FULL_44_10]|nr:MAG: hypothetical protein A3C46_02970 [Deltaproteobacteria bacterium RIFCSPHIGHO2_02_FULL_44_16]OGQ46218.1 MAG: hypothetical protein A3I05_03395 [Deltaproteobacteria bacterium RIFCSPLOWO2_02_FULL_44_10]